MLISECYELFGGSYEEAKNRLFKDELIKKFLIKFKSEASYKNIQEALEAGDYETAFRASHSLKGVAANLSLLRLRESASDLTELLRNSSAKTIDRELCDKLFAAVSKAYYEVIEAIVRLE